MFDAKRGAWATFQYLVRSVSWRRAPRSRATAGWRERRDAAQSDDLRRTAIALAVLAVALGANSSSGANVPSPRIVVKPIPFGPAVAETRAYAGRHYHLDTWRLRRPRVIVEHYTASDSFASAYSTFASNAANLGELPGVCAHYVIDTDGTIYRLVRRASSAGTRSASTGPRSASSTSARATRRSWGTGGNWMHRSG